MSTLSALDRRTIAQLGQPRNVDHLAHELRVDNFTKTRPSDEVFDHLNELASRGLVVNLGSFASSSDAALAAVDNKESFDFTDESAQIFERRLDQDRHLWRLDGDLWVISKEGVEALHAPDENEAPPLTPSQVQALIEQEWERTLKGVDAATYGARYGGEEYPDGPALTAALLEDEFLHWAGLVADECQRVWGKRPILPLAGGAGYTDAYESSLIDAENQKTGLGAVVDPWYMALTVLAFTDTDTGTTADDGSHKPTYTGYARKSVAGTDMNAASSGSATNANAIIFAGCSGGSSTILGFGNCSASTLGTLRKYGTCSSTAISTNQTPAQFAASSYTTSVD